MLKSLGERTKWYEEELRPVYNNLNKYKKQLGLMTQATLAENAKELQEGYYRSIMPGIIAVGAGLMLVLLFNYFLNIYFISPIILISKGIKNYREYNKSYSVQLENDDELQDLNSDVKSIIDENRNLKREKQQHEL
jgi:methyl-accepting chemotaxis protein